MKKNKTGFTLVELLVTMAIIGILAAVILISMQGYAKDARATKALTQASSVIPSMVSCWGNGGTVNNPAGTYTAGGSASGEGGNDICTLGSSYGKWPLINSNVSNIDLKNYYYNTKSLASSFAWYFRVTSTASNDDIAICCNSTMKNCSNIGGWASHTNCLAPYNP